MRIIEGSEISGVGVLSSGGVDSGILPALDPHRANFWSEFSLVIKCEKLVVC